MAPTIAAARKQTPRKLGSYLPSLLVATCSLQVAGCALDSHYDGEEGANHESPATASCVGYFCDKTLDEIFIVTTHNALALPSLVFSPNQNNGLKKQFEDGVRGFGLDLYTYKDEEVFTKHGPFLEYDPKFQIDGLIEALRKSPNEFVMLNLEDYMSTAGRDKFVGWFGNSLITNFDITKDLGHYLSRGKQVLIVTDNRSNVEESIGIHSTHQIVTSNEYEWKSCYGGSPPMKYRRGPKKGVSFKLMNHFCSATGTGDMVAAGSANKIQRILHDARRFITESYTEGKLNSIQVDYYETGDVFGAQKKIRAGSLSSGCWKDGRLCGIGTTCWSCCSDLHEYWYSKAMTACGKEPCWPNGTACAKGTTCNACCSGSSYWYSKAFTACGQERCWKRGTTCAMGTTCNACCNGASWWWSKFFTACN